MEDLCSSAIAQRARGILRMRSLFIKALVVVGKQGLFSLRSIAQVCVILL